MPASDMDSGIPGSGPVDTAVAHAEDKLVRLGVQVDAMQAALVRLLQDVVRAQGQLEPGRAAHLVEANEQLVLAALSSRTEAERATLALDEAEQSAAVDVLTRLPNRSTFLVRCGQAFASAQRHGSRLALLFVDLDNFKQLNDGHGHAFGDQVLRLAAARMLSAVRQGDTVGRHGGDEFLVLMTEVNEAGDAQAGAEKLIAAVEEPAVLDGQPVRVSASVGIAVYPDDGQDLQTLVDRADAAMYLTKRRRAGGIAFHGTGLVPMPAPAAMPEQPPRPAQSRRGDVTDPEQRFAQLREANENLVLAALTAQELQAAAERAQQQQAALIAAVAAELRNPAAPIRIATAMLGRLQGDDPLLLQVQRLIEQRGASVSRLVDRLVRASRPAPGGVDLQRRWVDMGAVVDAAVATFKPVMDARGQRFESTRPVGPLGVQGDAARLQQIVDNLLDNACTHTRSGGHIRLAVGVAAESLTLTVADDGIGITAQVLPHVFEPFVQDDHALGLNDRGLGIGLTVVRTLVRAHGGELVAHSQGARRGSRFVVTLPLAAAEGPATAQAARAAPGPGTGEAAP